MNESRVVFHAAHDLTIGDICLLFGNNTDAYEYVIGVEDDHVVIREGR